MGRSSYLGGHTIISKNGSGWSYDPAEVRPDNPKKKKTTKANNADTRKNKSVTKSPPKLSKKEQKESLVQKREREISLHAMRCAYADYKNKPRPVRPKALKNRLKHARQLARFEKLVDRFLKRLAS